MKQSFVRIAFAFLSLLLSAAAQDANTVAAPAATPQPTSAPAVAVQVPRLVKLSGTVQSFNLAEAGSGVIARDSASVPTNVVGMTFSLYSQQTGGVPLWSEVQNVRVDNTGHYTVKLGATKPDGLPVELFTSAEAQWLGVRQEGQAEQSRIMLMSVPYALKAADAETFGGKPPSAYMSATSSGAGAAGVSGTQTANGKQSLLPAVGGGGTSNYIAMWTTNTNLGSSTIYEATDHNIGIGTTTPEYPLVVHAHSSTEVVEVTQSGPGTAILGYSYATTGQNVGVQGKTASNEGVGLEGLASATTGEAIGVQGKTTSNDGIGVEGTATATTGITWGVHGESASSEGNGVMGEATSTTGTASGVVGNSASPDGVGVSASASSETGNTYGVFGTAESPSGVGVGGTANAATGFAVGVYGVSGSPSGVGVVGSATDETGSSAFGVKGVTASDAGVGVYGVANTDTGDNIGVEGTAESPDAGGVAGYNIGTTGSALGVAASTLSTEGVSLYAVAVAPSVTTASYRPVGVWGTTNQSGGVAVGGTADDGYAVGGANYSEDIATAGFENQEEEADDAPVFNARGTAFDGYCTIDVSGNLNCSGTTSPVVSVDGGARKVALYAMGAPENWFEDAGSARLANGSAVVQLESTFAQTVNSGLEYHVFLTPKGDCRGLYVTNETAASFEVRELGSGTASIAFDYRIMARRKGYENVRLADKTERVAKSAALDKQVHRKPPKLPAKASSTASLVPRPPLMRTVKAVPHVQRPNPAVRNSPSQVHN
jgi:hypothetical protein